MPGNSGYGWHQHFVGGPTSLLEFAAPFLFLALLLVLLAAGSSAGGRIAAYLRRRKSSAASPPIAASHSHALPSVLASDRERDETARLVARAVGEGRLTFDEGGQRIDAALRSRHRHELARLVADLPFVTAADPRPLVSRPLRLGLLALAALVIVAAVLAQVVAGLWELWPLAVAVLGVSALLPTARLKAQKAQRALPPGGW